MSLNDTRKLADSQHTEKQEEWVDEQHSFMLKVLTEKGPKQGVCFSKIPSTEERLKIGRIRARLTDGIPWKSFSADDQLLIDARATLAICLTDYPKWLDEVIEKRPDVLVSVYAEVRRHEALFFRQHAEKSGQQAGKPMVEITQVSRTATEPPADFQWERRDPISDGAVPVAKFGGAPAEFE